MVEEIDEGLRGARRFTFVSHLFAKFHRTLCVVFFFWWVAFCFGLCWFVLSLGLVL